MRKILVFITLSFFIFNYSYSFTKGKGEVKMSEESINHFINYIHGNGLKKLPEHDHKPKPSMMIMSSNGKWTSSWYCPWTQCVDTRSEKTIKECERDTGVSCGVFAARRTIYWDNGINTKKNKAKFKSKMSASEIRAKLKEYGFIGNIIKKDENNKSTKKIAKKTKVKGERSIAISWTGYDDLIIGKVGFEENDSGETSMNLKLPNNDGSCEGNYILFNGGKGTWQISCTNNMGAAGTLKWDNEGGVTGSGRDFNDKKVKFTVAKQS
tara:strand:- start:15 stop:815 length:801 start_codon:yes stop_codon:yes gene_type:complete